MLDLLPADVFACGGLLFYMLTGKSVCSASLHELLSCATATTCGLQLVRAMCGQPPAARLTAAAALEHPWLAAHVDAEDACAVMTAATLPPPPPFVCDFSSVLGTGAQSVVYRGSMLGTDVAVKVMSRGGTRPREYRLLQGLPPHPHVMAAPIPARSSTDGRSMFAMRMADAFLHDALAGHTGKLV